MSDAKVDAKVEIDGDFAPAATAELFLMAHCPANASPRIQGILANLLTLYWRAGYVAGKRGDGRSF
jgi:hypothetical protein